MDERGRDALELEIEDEQDEHQGDGDDHREALGGVDLLLVGARELVGHALGQHNLTGSHQVVDVLLCVVHHIDLGIAGAHLVEGDIAHEEGVLGGDHRVTLHKAERGQLPQGYLCAVGGRHEYALQHVGVVAQLAGIAHTYGVALAAFHGAALRHAADGRLDDALHGAHLYAVAPQLLAVGGDLDVGRAGGTVVVDRGGVDVLHLLEGFLHLSARLLDRLQVGAVDLQAHGGPHACGEHHLARSDGLQLRTAGEAWQLGGCRDLGPDVVVGTDALAPLAEVFAVAARHQTVARDVAEGGGGVVDAAALQHEAAVAVGLEAGTLTVLVEHILGFVVDGHLIHLDGCGVEGALGASPLAHGRLHLGYALDALVELLGIAQVLFHAAMGHRGGHEHEGALVEGGHKLAAGVAPDEYSGHKGAYGQEHEFPAVVEAPAQYLFIPHHDAPEQGQHHAHDGQHKEHVDHDAVVGA